MVTLKLVDMQGADQGAVEASDAVFNVVVSEALVYDVITGMLAALRQGNHDTKTRREVAGGGGKPFRQKGTGRARRGSSREPQLRGGGTVFGPHPRSYRHNTPAGMKRKALCGVLSDRARTERLRVLDGLEIIEPKTKTVSQMLHNVVPDSRKTLLVMADYDKNVLLSSRNIPDIYVRTAAEVSALDVIRAHQVLLQKEALPKLEERLS